MRPPFIAPAQGPSPLCSEGDSPYIPDLKNSTQFLRRMLKTAGSSNREELGPREGKRSAQGHNSRL